jgi:hypothetical protein
MRSKLAVEMKQKVDDEDDRLAKAVAERDDKLAKEEQAKQETELLTKKSIHQHRIDKVSTLILYALEFLTDSFKAKFLRSYPTVAVIYTISKSSDLQPTPRLKYLNFLTRST